MRPLRFLLTLSSCIVAFFLLLYSVSWRGSAGDEVKEQSSIRAYFNWRTPSSLFPPSAIISLTDDNSTFFLARPAAFGPLLPAKSLSGQLWIGSGFGDDHLGRSGSGAEGELGCSDVPGWSDGNYSPVRGSGKSLSDAKNSWAGGEDGVKRRSKRSETSLDNEEQPEGALEDDGTDDHLHHPLPASDGLKTNGGSAGHTKKPAHADIQSLQESAEIAGKIVLLSRGGCGFLEKVKWVQRRGGVALIVGDDIRGEPLVTMYARGDTSNVTIPSLFTSHTTAHLLSSLIPSGVITQEEAERLGLALGEGADTAALGAQKNSAADRPNFTTTTTAVKSTKTPPAQEAVKPGLTVQTMDDHDGAPEERRVGWLGSLFGRRANSGKRDTRRPPSSGSIGWVLQEEFDEDDGDMSHDTQDKWAVSSTSSAPATTKTPDSRSGDGFVIGVQDWRDPDLVAQQKEELMAAASSSTSSVLPQSSKSTFWGGPKGGSITPGSGEYSKDVNGAANLAHSKQSTQVDSSEYKEISGNANSGGWFGRWFSSYDDKETSNTLPEKLESLKPEPSTHLVYHQEGTDSPELHEGLWVTLTPTSMSSSPFFDTLLVLVVSPLVTLTVVYALLLLRSRIRRRRWRAPKSVVERLPVRTYQTMPSTTNTSSTTSSISSPISASTPLLASQARPISGRPRPRSRTDGEVPLQASSSLQSDSITSPSLDQIEEKRAAGLAEWRRRYVGKQRECVVCLEEYVDGVSRVMSLPCGHEFHAECMYVPVDDS